MSDQLNGITSIIWAHERSGLVGAGSCEEVAVAGREPGRCGEFTPALGLGEVVDRPIEGVEAGVT